MYYVLIMLWVTVSLIGLAASGYGAYEAFQPALADWKKRKSASEAAAAAAAAGGLAGGTAAAAAEGESVLEEAATDLAAEQDADEDEFLTDQFDVNEEELERD